jgi:hypothetical protein
MMHDGAAFHEALFLFRIVKKQRAAPPQYFSI